MTRQGGLSDESGNAEVLELGDSVDLAPPKSRSGRDTYHAALTRLRKHLTVVLAMLVGIAAGAIGSAFAGEQWRAALIHHRVQNAVLLTAQITDPPVINDGTVGPMVEISNLGADSIRLSSVEVVDPRFETSSFVPSVAPLAPKASVRVNVATINPRCDAPIEQPPSLIRVTTVEGGSTSKTFAVADPNNRLAQLWDWVCRPNFTEQVNVGALAVDPTVQSDTRGRPSLDESLLINNRSREPVVLRRLEHPFLTIHVGGLPLAAGGRSIEIGAGNDQYIPLDVSIARCPAAADMHHYLKTGGIPPIMITGSLARSGTPGTLEVQVADNGLEALYNATCV